MKQFPKSLQQKLQQREEQNALRQLPIANDLIDFASNDYIGFAKNETIFHEEKLGSYAARNLGITRAKGKFLAIVVIFTSMINTRS